jgi:hypothetical protein
VDFLVFDSAISIYIGFLSDVQKGKKKLNVWFSHLALKIKFLNNSRKGKTQNNNKKKNK